MGRAAAPPRRAIERLQAIWASKGFLFGLLVLLSGLYKALSGLRALAYQQGWLRTDALPVPVVVVGNVLAGGAGKTPTVIALAEHFRQKGSLIGVISRGYGRRRGDCELVHATSQAQNVGDEPLLVHRRCHIPVAVAPKRIDAARLLLKAYPDTQLLICDDGLQHLALGRDLEIVVFDDRGVGNGHLLPAGWLREPWPRRADLVLHTGDKPADVGMAGFTGKRYLASVLRNGLGQTCLLPDLLNKPVLALAAIAHPDRFFGMLRQNGLTLTDTLALPDHADLSDWQMPAKWASLGTLPVLCTEKDAYKIWVHHPGVWAVQLNFEPEAAFFAKLDDALALIQRSPPFA